MARFTKPCHDGPGDAVAQETAAAPVTRKRDVSRAAESNRLGAVGGAFGLPSVAGRVIFGFTQSRKEGRAMTTSFLRYRKRGPVHALQMRLQG
jgi:hypothetical protein